MFRGGASLAHKEEGFDLIPGNEVGDFSHGLFNDFTLQKVKSRVRVGEAEGADDIFAMPRSVGRGPPVVSQQYRDKMDSRRYFFKKCLDILIPARELITS